VRLTTWQRACGCVLACSLILPAAFSSAAAQAQAPSGAVAGLRILWDQRFGREAAFTDFRAIAAAGDGVLVGATEREALQPGSSSINKLLLWSIDGTGKQVRETQLVDPSAGAKGTNTASIRDIRVLADGRAVLLVDFEAGRPSLVTVDKGGKQSASHQVLPAGRSPTLFQIVPSANGKQLLIGHESLDALAILVDATGAVLWEKKQDRGRMEFLVDGLPTTDGGFVLVGNSGQYDALRAGPSSVWVGYYDAAGTLTSEVTFKGRYGRIARSESGGLALLYDESDSNAQRIVVKGLDAKLGETWRVPLLETTTGFSDFRIAPLANGGFVAAGGRNGTPYLAVVDRAGKVSKTFEGQPVERALDVGSYGIVPAANGAVVLASSHIDTRGAGNVQQKVRVRKVAM